MGSGLKRVVDTRIDALFAELPAISIEGARGVGKTTARQRAATFLALDDAPVLELLQADSRVVGTYPPPVVIDEWQRVPAVFDAVRRAVDENRSAGRFLITGSASPRQPPTHTGAGRIVTLRMRPLSLAEPTVSLASLLSGEQPDVGAAATPAGRESQALTPRLDVALVDAEDRVGDPRRIASASLFDLERRPAWVASRLGAV